MIEILFEISDLWETSGVTHPTPEALPAEISGFDTYRYLIATVNPV